MTAPPDLNDLKLSITNFGPIAKADIDLRPMTVFVGPSNTGKSYMAMLVYALHGFCSGKAILSRFPLDIPRPDYIRHEANLTGPTGHSLARKSRR